MTELPLEAPATVYEPAESDAPEQPPWGPFRGRLGITLSDLRHSMVFAALPRPTWHAFVAIACHWHAGVEAWPSQATIARVSGYSLRAVRDAVAELELRGVLQLRRRRDEYGFERIDYAPGPATFAALPTLGRRVPPP